MVNRFTHLDLDASTKVSILNVNGFERQLYQLFGRRYIVYSCYRNMAVPIGTALIYDQEMTKYKLLWDDLVCKIEVPERLTASYQALVKSGLSERCISVPARQATDEEILLTHSVEYLEAVKKTCFMNVEELMTFTQQYEDVYFHPNIYHCAKLAVGAALQLVDSVMMGRVRNGMALVRPPGHHSQRSAANGFCVFNNVAIAAHYAKKKYGVKRVLIVDWDVHHGQGVQYSFEEDPSVLYFSWHRYEHQSFWPNLRESDYDSVGKGKGVGFNINVPWNKVGMENSDYLLIFFHVLLPVAYEFCPDLVMVCAGFDSAIGDPEGCMCATPDIFAHLTHLLMHLAGGKLCAVLEGGYNLTSLSQSVCQTVHTLLGDPAPCPSELGGPSHSALESLQCVRATQKPHWACLKNTVDPSTCEFSTSNLKTSTKDEIGKDVQFACELVEREKAEADNVDRLIWQEHPSRLASSIRTAVELPDGVEVPNNCISTHSPLTSNLVVREHLRENFFKESVDEDILVSLCNVVALVEKIAKNEVRNGLALVPDISLATICAVQQALGLLINRVLLVLIGDEAIPKRFTDDGKVLLVRIGRMEQEDPIPPSKYHIPVHLEKGCCDMAGFMHAVLGLLLPVAYEYDPKLVLLVHMPNSGAQDIAWAQLTSLLQGLAEGHTLALIQVNKMSCIRPTAASLLGEPAPSLGELGAPLQKDGDAMIRLRKRLETDWELLKTTAFGITE